MEKQLIQIRDLTKYYGSFKALENVNMHVNQGDIYGLVGKNGAGKTTLFKTILGLSDVQSGEISLLGSHHQQELLKARRHIGFLIGQNFYGDMNATQNIDYYRQLKGIKDKAETQRVLEIVGLDKVTKTFKHYSMGMKQRLGIANAILGSPEILILDEPINGLDPQGIKEVRSLIKTLNETYGMTLIVSSHILSELDLVAHRFGILDGGKLIKEFDKEVFETKQEASIILKTHDINKAKNLIEKTMNETVLLKNTHLELINPKVSVSNLIHHLTQNDIDIDGIYREVKSLENIYFELTEKEGH